jgi:riboflavin kinase/FMN adenylyltransferase
MGKRVIAIGFFDGVHIGHATLIEKAKERANELSALPALLTFDVHPDSIVRGERVPLISSPEDRADIVRHKFNVDEIISIRFDENVMKMPWDTFVEWMAEDFEAVHLVVGYDFRFGYKNEGTTDKLKVKCAQLGLGLDIMPKVELDGIAVSSTYIRNLLAEGRIKEANRFLGYPLALTDTVRVGYRRGSKMGAPTVNMRFSEGVIVPAYGVYATRVRIEGECVSRGAVTNIGERPTVSNDGSVSVESYILDYSGNLYGKRLRLEFIDFIRPERKFSDMAELKEQIVKDTKTAREILKK